MPLKGAVTNRLSDWGTGGVDRLSPRGFGRAVSLTLATRVSGIVAGIVTLTLTTRLLGPQGRGEFSVVMAALASVLQVSSLGLTSAAVYFLSRDPTLRARMVGLLLGFSLTVPTLAALGAYALVAWAGGPLGAVPLHLLAIALTAAPPAMFVLLASNALLGLGDETWFNGLDLAAKAAGVVAVGVLLWWPLTGVFAVYAVLQCALALWAYALLRGKAEPAIPDPALVREVFGYGMRACLVQSLMFLVLRIDLFLVNWLAGTADAGRYSVAVQVGEVLNLASASVAVMLFPRLSAMAPDRRWSAAWQVVRVMSVVLALLAVGLALVGRVLFDAWFGPAFSGAVVALWWLLPGLWCLGVNAVLHQYMAASGFPWFLVGATGAGLGLNLLLNMRLIPAFGIAGAAAASTVVYATLLATSAVYVRRMRLAAAASRSMAEA